MFLKEATYLPVQIDDIRINRFVTEMQRIWVNGGAWIRCVEATTSLEDRFPGIQKNVAEFFNAPSVRNCFPELKIPESPEFPTESVIVRRHQFEGILTDILLEGGAYRKFEGNYKEGRQIVQDCVDALAGLLWDSPVDIGSAFFIPRDWTPAFFGVCWDATFVLRSKGGRRWVVMWMTDTD
jgi:hypothetical protein